MATEHNWTLSQLTKAIEYLQGVTSAPPAKPAYHDLSCKGPGPTPPIRKSADKQYAFERKVVQGLADRDLLSDDRFQKIQEAYQKDLTEGGYAHVQAEYQDIIKVHITDGRLHRAKGPVMITEELTKQVRDFLEIPDSHLTPMADGGGHGAQLMAWMNLLRPPAAETPQKVVVLDFGAFGTRWAGDLQEMHDKGQIDLEVRKVSEGDFPSMVGIDLSADIVFCGNETSAGVGIKEDALADFVTKREAAQREAGITGVNAGKIIMDATSAAGCMHIPDSVAYSLPAQKVIGGNSTTAWLVIPEEFTDRIELEKPWAIPSLFSLHKRNPETGEKTPDHGIRSGNVLIRSVLTRDIYETLICVDELNRLGGLDASIARCEAGSRHFQEALAAHSYGLEKIVATPSIQGNFNCVIKCTHPYYQALSGAEQKEVLKRTHEILEKEEREFDIKAFPGGDGAFRVTTIHVANPDEAKNLVDNIQYGLNRAMCEMLEEKLAVETERVAETGRSMLMHVMTDTSPRGLALQEAIAIQAERDAEGFAARQAARQAESRSYHRA